MVLPIFTCKTTSNKRNHTKTMILKKQKKLINHPEAKPRGFTLVELLLVLVILGVLAAIVVPKFSGRTEQAKEQAARTQISTFQTALGTFEVDNGYYPRGRQPGCRI
jgi:prepilin-type N-terminal cleavage/methylation domain-containing protein